MTYTDQFQESHTSDCPWKTSWCPDALQYATTSLTADNREALLEVIAGLEQFSAVSIRKPTELAEYTTSVVLAICFWNSNGDEIIDCKYGCSKCIDVDDKLHPILEHRWCCPAVHLDPAAQESTGWKSMLQLYKWNRGC